MAPLRFDRRMSDTEALMWALEDDPVLRSTFANVTFLDCAPDLDDFRGRMLMAIDALPRLPAMSLDTARDATEPLGGVPEPAIIEDSAGQSAGDMVRSAMKIPMGIARGGYETLSNNPMESIRSILRQVAVTEPSFSPLWV